jgi:uncharacterized phage protein gp47/JayE
MPFTPPTPQQIRDRLAAAVETALPGADARSRRSIEGALVRMWAMAASDLYGFGAWLSRQVTVNQCDAEALDQTHGPIWGITRKQPAPAGGLVTFSGSPTAVIPAGTVLSRGDGATYTVCADITIASGGTGTGAVIAVVAGSVGNAGIGTSLTVSTTISGVAGTATVADDGSGNGLSGGTDLEPDDDFRGRILTRIQLPPHGGRAPDYLEWATSVPGVTRAWILPGWLGPGTVGVTFVADNQTGSIVPSTTLVATVQAAIDAERPVTAAVTVFAPILDPTPLTLAINPSTAATQAAVIAAIADHFHREATPGGTLYGSRLLADISAAAGVYRVVMTAPASDVVSAPGHLAVPGPVTWGVYS